MQFDFQCTQCRAVVTISGRIGHTPKTPYHHRRPMRRLYHALRFDVQRSISEYVERAARGEEQVPGFTTKEVRDMVDKSFTRSS